MTVKDWIECLEHAKEHYPISDEFIRTHQQDPRNPKGYMYYAWKMGHPICREIAEPNQRWHFFESYVAVKIIMDGKSFLDSDAKDIYLGGYRKGKGLQCPELLLWIGEASGIDSQTIEDAAREAKSIIDQGGSRQRAAKEIKRYIRWELLEENYNKFLKSANIRTLRELNAGFLPCRTSTITDSCRKQL